MVVVVSATVELDDDEAIVVVDCVVDCSVGAVGTDVEDEVDVSGSSDTVGVPVDGLEVTVGGGDVAPQTESQSSIQVSWSGQ